MDFANILFGGPCNRACPFCIGKQLAAPLRSNNLGLYPPRNLEAFIGEVKRHRIREIVFTGTTTDPQLYRFEERLLQELQSRLPEARFCLHSNGALALRKIHVFNQYDRVSLSFPTFDPATYERLMGSRRIPDLAEIVRQARVPIKISALARETTAGFLDRLCSLGILRVVLRKLYGDSRPLSLPSGLIRVDSYRNNPVFNWKGMEVTVWSFNDSASTSLNLFPDGTLSSRYLLTRAEPGLSNQEALSP
ncbi:MAG: radical SAM protein [Vulcanimicrobiota bacterium]